MSEMTSVATQLLGTCTVQMQVTKNDHTELASVSTLCVMALVSVGLSKIIIQLHVSSLHGTNNGHLSLQI